MFLDLGSVDFSCRRLDLNQKKESQSLVAIFFAGFVPIVFTPGGVI